MLPNEPNRSKLNSREARELLADGQWAKDEEMSKLMFANVYMHPDGRVLTVFFNKRGMLYPTQEEFGLLVELFKYARTQKPRHILKDRLPGEEDFPSCVPQLVEELGKLLKIPRVDLDSSMDSLWIVQKKVKRLGRVKCIEPPIFAGLVAYIGEVVRQQVNGKWKMLLSEQDGETWEPWIIDPEGRLCNLFSYLYDQLAEPWEAISIPGAAAIAISTRHPPLSRRSIRDNPNAAVRSIIFKRIQHN